MKLMKARRSHRLSTMLVMFLAITTMAWSKAPEHSIRGNREIPKHTLATKMRPGLWKEIRNQEYNIYFQLLVGVENGGGVHVKEIVHHYPEEVSTTVAENLTRHVQLHFPQLGKNPREGMVHLMLYRHTSEGAVAVLLAEPLNVPTHVTEVNDFLQVIKLEPAG